MDKPISAADANRKFSQLLRDVSEGQSYVVTSRGKPVARISPVITDASARDHKALLRRLRSQRVVNIGHWQREELY
jgi:prevent-host-death family protein